MGGERVLVVEEDVDLRDVLVESLACEGLDVVAAELDQLPRGAFGVVVTDVPFWPYESSGTRRWIDQLRARYGGARVVLCTAQRRVHGEPDRLGADAIIDMPFDIGELLARVADLLDAHMGPGALSSVARAV